jgi:membrane protease YdiL (CAAX protease family)
MKVRKSLLGLFVLILVFVLLTVAAAPMRQGEEPALTEAQLVIVGLIASALTWVFKLIVSRGYEISREWMAVALYGISFLVAILFTPLAFPPFPVGCGDGPTCVSAFLSWVASLLTLATPVVGVAYLIYNIFLKRVLEGLILKK